MYPCVYSLLQNTGFYLLAKVLSLCWIFLQSEGHRNKAVSVILQVWMRVLSLTLESYPCSSWHHKGKISRAANLSKLSQFLSSPQSPPPSSRLHLFLFFFLNKGMNLITWGRDWKWRLSFSLWFAAEAKLFLFPLESLFSELVIYTRWTSCRLKMPPGWIKLLLPKFLLLISFVLFLF